jgi:protein-disulfide isomerase
MALKLFYTFLIVLVGILVYRVYVTYDARSSLTNPSAAYVIGPEEADLVVNEFIDYACPYCREMHPIFKEAMEQDGRVALAPRPLLSSNAHGTGAAYIFYAAGMNGKAEEAHNYLMENDINITDDRLPELAEALGVELEKLMDDLGAEEPNDQINNNYKMFNTFGGTGTPTFFIGPDLVYLADEKMPSVQDFLDLFAEARAMQ